jgi:hypothetical protein
MTTPMKRMLAVPLVKTVKRSTVIEMAMKSMKKMTVIAMAMKISWKERVTRKNDMNRRRKITQNQR